MEGRIILIADRKSHPLPPLHPTHPMPPAAAAQSPFQRCLLAPELRGFTDAITCWETTPVKAGGMRVSKKQESGPVEKNAKAPGKEKTSAVAGFSKTQNTGVLLAEVLSKMTL
ncbi:death-associated protein-like 1 isoform X3 [Athene noctua]|uniref:death-associated protein-like 1 isoform X3 n=1 Tax=Athene noctua TaxID=126797 RepID=UPI003EBCB96E